MGRLRWSEEQLRKSDINAIQVAWRGYIDEQDDFNRTVYSANGCKYPSKDEVMGTTPKTSPRELLAHLRSVNKRFARSKAKKPQPKPDLPKADV